ncbi:MAG TPA: histidine--tRNA ligase, partial [Oscillospiraceae bacterium]|nr:histidine--tRNA ligase [Oscillospiraceae bacterium]
MAILTKAPRGTQDILPDESGKWQYVERTVLSIAELYGYKEIRFPTFEHTELFARGVGDSTDVVEKEMYTFNDKGGRSLTLRPEGTSGVMRAVIEHGLLGGALPLKVSYLTSCFRYEKPQAGRLREFHQFGAECIGTESAAADAEMIALASQVFDELGAKGIRLEINSIGCPKCRKTYHEALKAYFTEKKDHLCETCLDRLERNPMRILDCKCPECQETAKGAPTILEFLCDDCKAHFEDLKARLSAMDIAYTVNPTIVRGLDYYTRTVFEFVSTQIGAQGTVCGGGR